MNRGTLKRACKKGQLFLKCSYDHSEYNLDAGVDGKEDAFSLCVFLEEGKEDDCWKKGCYGLRDHDFRCKSGRIWQHDENSGTLRIHSNLSYQFEIRK